MTATGPGILVELDPEQSDPQHRAWCPCGWLGDPRPCPIQARADLLVHRHTEHNEPL